VVDEVSAGGNQAYWSNDYRGMKCQIAREALSAWLDDEQSVPGRAEVNAHVGGCGDCRSWQEGAHRLTRQVWLKPVRPMSVDTGRILEAVIDDRAARRGVRGPRRFARGWFGSGGWRSWRWRGLWSSSRLWCSVMPASASRRKRSASSEFRRGLSLVR
jgi:hypothetical protein